jgi:hypothetical protein
MTSGNIQGNAVPVEAHMHVSTPPNDSLERMQVGRGFT